MLDGPERRRTSDTGAPWRDHISPVLRRLPVRQRVQFKLAVLVFKALHGQAPQCSTDDRQLDSQPQLTSAIVRLVSGPRLWNALPISLRQPHLSLGQFRRALKRIYLTVTAGPSDFFRC